MGIYVTGVGIITSLGRGWPETSTCLLHQQSSIAELSLFAHTQPFAVGEVKQDLSHPELPRTHLMAGLAAEDALQACGGKAPDAVVLGVTTGGMPKTEVHLQAGAEDPALYRYHSTGSAAAYLAELCNCSGPAFTVSTACSSGAAAVALGARLLQSGLAGSVLAGGADALCRLTCYGFNSLQLLSPQGARPFDRERNGMSLSEAAAMLFLESAEQIPKQALAKILGIGLSCDAYHAAAPHPEGLGACRAMRSALQDAGLGQSDIDYINLHGTGTINNDASEARAVNRLFGQDKPRTSSIKGATGHSLGAAGAVELAVCTMCIAEGWVPANQGLQTPDPELDLQPQAEPESCSLQRALSNSFGFGGNNAALVLGRAQDAAATKTIKPAAMGIRGISCLTGAGKTQTTVESFLAGSTLAGMLPLEQISAGLPARSIRRLKRLPRLALCLAKESSQEAGLSPSPCGVFFSTGWGALSETESFLSQLFQSQERFCSPMDFVGSVHNAPAGEIAMMFSSEGPNITMTGGDYSFEQALTAASLLHEDLEQPFLVVGADESHFRLSPLFDPSVSCAGQLADGGGGLCLVTRQNGLQLQPRFFRPADTKTANIQALVQSLGGPACIQDRYGALFAGIPASCRDIGQQQLHQFQELAGFQAPVVDYRKYTGEYASASATAICLAGYCLQAGSIPPAEGHIQPRTLDKPAILVLGTGVNLTAVEVFYT
ncbi:MAG: beta-ketoacyl-[acyl-carrier-protein] synthase family protein [Thermodesulfobacteriota bacterium]